MSDREDFYRMLETRVRGLSQQLGPMPSGYCDLFDEFLSHREFGLALETLCDCVFESGQALASDKTLEEIEALHALMNVSDDCVARLRRLGPRAFGEPL